MKNKTKPTRRELRELLALQKRCRLLGTTIEEASDQIALIADEIRLATMLPRYIEQLAAAATELCTIRDELRDIRRRVRKDQSGGYE